MNSDSSPYIDDQYPDSLGGDLLSIALIGPDEDRRKAATTALAGCQSGEIREFSTYPPSLDDVPKLLEQNYDVIIIDLDSHPEYALELVESICANGASTVMVYSVKADSELLVRCMRAGAREFLTMPFAQNTMAEALVRASARRPATRIPKKAGGRLLGFLGAQGGGGATMLACNFAVAMAQESGQSTLLIDLNLPLGDAALNLGVVAEYSTINALQNAARLDSNFLSSLLVKHSSGVAVLAAPGKFPTFPASNDAIDRLIMVARQDFENVVIDMGTRLDLMGTSLFKNGSTVYLVTQATIAGLRNSNRLISQYFATGVPKLEIVLNRFEKSMGVSEDQITKALTRPANWKIPNDFNAVRRMQTTAIPLALEDSPISRLIHQMSRTACGLPATPEKKSGFSLKSLRGGGFSKASNNTEESSSSSITSLGLGRGAEDGNAAPETPPYSSFSARSAERSTYRAPEATPPARESQPEFMPSERADRSERGGKRGEMPSIRTPEEPSEPETRIYKGSLYEKNAEGEWHLKQTQGIGGRDLQSEPETRVYKGSTYVKGTDGGWHLQEAPAEEKNQAEEQRRAEEGRRAEEERRADEERRAAEVRRVVEEVRRVEEIKRPEEVMRPAEVKRVEEIRRPEEVVQRTPAIEWPAPAPVPYGTALGPDELNATASVPGTFTYSRAAGDMLAAGTHTLSVIFTPVDAAGYTRVQAEAPLTVTKATPILTWPAPAAIAYGTVLSATQLHATASVPGGFIYSPAAGDVPGAGAHKLTVLFTPNDAANYTPAQAEVPLTVTKATPIIKWQAPSVIPYGSVLGAAQLNASASIPGGFEYFPAAGAMVPAGVQTLSATFTPTDAANFTTVQATVTLTVTKGTPTISWPTPASIHYGTPLGTAQLNASASVPGDFVYSPAAGEVIPSGSQTLSVTFTPTDTTNYTAVQAAVPISVSRGKAAITWPKPDPITYGTPLSATQLNATASVAGKFVYLPGEGAVLSAGTHTPSVTFTPEDTTNYTAARAAVSLTVTRATPAVSWQAPDAIAYGTALSATQLNATASVPGKFAYTPAAGEVLGAGTHTLSVTFTPNDATDYAAVQATVSLTVGKAKPTDIEWPTPAAISRGTALSANELNAKAPVPGTFVYSPASGEVLATGTHTLTATFTPADANFPAVQTSVQLVVTKLMPKISWSKPAAISYGTALSDTELKAKASIPGTFVYTPAAGEVLSAGSHTLSVAFTPADTSDAAPAEASVSFTVNKATPILSWQTPASIPYGTALSSSELNASASVPGAFIYTPSEGTVIAAGTQTLSVTFTPTNTADYTTAQASVSLVVEGLDNIASLLPAILEADPMGPADGKRGASPSGSSSNQQNTLETRTYKGATYVKGADGQWYLQKK
ncbi:MAG: hypothetical protein ABSE51_00355 [Terracidiphilus sp.]